ncbi:MAG: iron-containing alcohol dehydrogenase, partial [Chloroflexi bacterium]|nr:iron-containing alcohol dehydrogenase [Chloroflexota bacterium]
MNVTSEAPSGVFQFLPVDRVVFGPGKLDELPRQVEQLGASRAFVITGRSLATKTDLVRRVEALLGERHAGTYAETGQHVPSQGVIHATRRARAAGADLLVSFGGGSPVDCTKLVAWALAEGFDDAAELSARADRTNRIPPSRPPAPHIAITTTLSAAEFTLSAGISNEETGYKGSYGHPSLAPKVVILDPELTHATPNRLWTSTGIKALDHAVERLYSRHRQPLTNALCREAIRLLLRHLPASTAATGNTTADRGQCQLAAWLSIFGMNNVRTGLSHALGHQLGARCHVPHGITSCVTMPHVVAFMGWKSPEELVDLAPAFSVAPDDPNTGTAIAGQ